MTTSTHILTREQFNQLHTNLLMNFKGSCSAEVMRMLLKSETYEAFKSKVQKGFTPVSNKVKLENGAAPFYTRDTILGNLSYALSRASRGQSDFILYDSSSQGQKVLNDLEPQLRMDLINQKLQFLEKCLSEIRQKTF